MENFGFNHKLLLQEFNKYNPRAFECIFKAYYPSLSYYALKLTGSKLASEDIVQNVFIRLWKNRNRFDTIPALKSFLYLSVRNGSFDEKKRVTLRHNLVKKIAKIQNMVPLSEKELAHVLDAETLGILYRSILMLPPACRKVIMMSLSGRKNAEISQILNISINTVRAHKQKALMKLKDTIPHLLFILFTIKHYVK